MAMVGSALSRPRQTLLTLLLSSAFWLLYARISCRAVMRPPSAARVTDACHKDTKFATIFATIGGKNHSI